MNKHSILLAGVLAVSAIAAQAQVSLGSLGTYTQNFGGYTAFDAAAQPAGWSTVFTGTEAYRGFTSDGSTVAIAGSSAGSITSGGLFSWGQELAGPAVGNSTFAWQGTGGTSNMATTVSFTNNTGGTITGLDVSFDAFQWRKGASSASQLGRFSTLTLGATNVAGLNPFVFTAQNQSSLSQTAVARASGAAAPAGFTADTPFSQSLSGLSIANGDTFSFSFTYDRGTGSGSAQGIALDNFSLTTSAIPEPSAFAALAGLAALGLSATRRRRRV